MLKRKNIRQKGKFSFLRFFQEFKPGDKVAVVKELSFPFAYSKRMQGRTGVIKSPRGDSYEIEINDLNKKKVYFIHPIHLKKISQ